MVGHSVLASGLVERIGEVEVLIKCKLRPDYTDELVINKILSIPDHKSGMLLAKDFLSDSENGVIAGSNDIAAVGHRVVHGGEDFHKPTFITSSVLAAIEKKWPFCTTAYPFKY